MDMISDGVIGGVETLVLDTLVSFEGSLSSIHSSVTSQESSFGFGGVRRPAHVLFAMFLESLLNGIGAVAWDTVQLVHVRE